MTLTSMAAPDDKGTFVREMFASIAPRYDLVNRVMTGGLDERWRRRAIALLALAPGAANTRPLLRHR